MKKLLLLLICCLQAGLLFAQDNTPEIAIIPEPVTLNRNPGQFILPQHIIIKGANIPAVKPVIDLLEQRLGTPTGATVTYNNTTVAPTISLLLNKTAEEQIGTEGYHLLVTTKGITIRANQVAGLFYGVQTLLQLLPKEIESRVAVAHVKWAMPCVGIVDYPRFKWRGLMFDVSRHFFTKADVKEYIDDMVRYKYNLLHLHLSDDEGWRVEIKSLPKLTTVGAYNVKKVGYFGTFSQPGPDEPRNNGGFYTQDDIRELVAYAKARFVDILPEFDMPGHSLAAIASYPELSCTPGADQYKVNSGEPFMIWSSTGISAKIDNTLCPANDKVYDFIDKVVTEVAKLFPFEYIHLGGDECAKNFWAQSDAVKALMAKENLANMNEVQSYFEKRVEKIVESKGKKFMGWDEILEGGLAPDAVVMSWRGMKGGVQAAKMGHEVVMSPTTYTYLDYMQGDVAIEPRVYETLRLSTAYQFNPQPDSVDAKYIKGGQANLWTEQVYNMRHAQYMTWPRGMAVAESVWSPKDKKNWNNFFGKVEKHFARLEEADIKYAPSVYDPIIRVADNADKTLRVELSSEVSGLDIYYTFDNSFPDRFYPKYTGPLTVPKEAFMLRVITYRGNKQIGRMITVPIADLSARVRRKSPPPAAAQ